MFTSQVVYPSADVTEWRLANGVRFAFRPMRTPSRQLTLLAMVPGGYRQAPRDRPSAALAALDLVVPDDAQVLVQPRLADDTAFLLGVGTTDRLEELLRSVRAAMTEVHVEASPDGEALPLDEALEALMAGLPREALMERPDPAAARAFYERQFGDPRPYTLLLVGDALPEEVERAVAATFGRLRPSAARLLAPSDGGAGSPFMPSQALTVRLPAHSGASEQVGLGFRAAMEPTMENRAALDVLAMLLVSALNDRLRTEVQVDVALDFASGRGDLRLYAEGVDEPAFDEAVRRVLGDLRRDGPGASALVQARAEAQAAFVRMRASHAGWLHSLAESFRYDLDPRELTRYERRIQGTSGQRVLELARTLLDTDRAIKIVRPSD